MSLLLLQSRREGDPALTHERTAFARIAGARLDQVQVWDLLSNTPGEEDFLAADCVLVGGSGEFGVGDATTHTWLSSFIDSMGLLTTLDVPVFASCFGFQALVEACGGKVETDRSRSEIGTFEVTVTEAGQDDELFQTVLPQFFAQFGHRDRATELPSIFENLARSERCEFQAFRMPDKRFYATQFHPELSMNENRERSLMYSDYYTKAGLADSFEEIMASFRESPQASALLEKFLKEHVQISS